MSLMLLITGTMCSVAQPVVPTIPPSSNRMVVAIKGEQMIEKMGFEKLMRALFDTKKENKNDDAPKVDKATQRKALAALYGAGIDFTKKMWVSMDSYTDNVTVENAYKLQPKPYLIIPIANREVAAKSLSTLLTNNTMNSISSTTSYWVSKRMIYLLQADVLIVTNIPYDYASQMSTDNWYGRTIKVDTILQVNDVVEVIPNNPQVEYVKPKPSYTIVDKLEGGKVIRVYKKKDDLKKSKYGSTNQIDMQKEEVIVESSVTTPLMDTAMMAPAVPVTADAAMNEAVKEMKMPSDTLTRFDYVNGKKIKITYVPYTDKEITDNETARVAKEKEAQQVYITTLISNTYALLPYNTKNADIVKIMQSDKDIAMYNSASYNANAKGIAGKEGMLIKLASGGMTNAMGVEYLSFLNFENGKMVGTSQPSCCSAGNEYVNKLYLPITNFWPTELLQSNIGGMRMHFDLPVFYNYLQSVMSAQGKFEKSMKEVGLTEEVVKTAFTGELALGVSLTKPTGNGRPKPQVVAAFKVKDVQAAIKALNTVASNDLSMINNYKFATNGEYIVFTSEKNGFSATKPKSTVPSTTYSTKLTGNNYGELAFDMKAMIQGTMRKTWSDDRKKSTKELANFFGSITMECTKTEIGNLESTVSVDMGNASSNALSNLVDFATLMNEIKIEERGAYSPATDTAVAVTAYPTYNKKVATKPASTNKKKTSTKPVANKKK